MIALNPHSNSGDTVRHLQEQIRKEMEQMSTLQRQMTEKQEDANVKKAEIPQLLKKVETDRHDVYVDEHDVMKLKSQLEILKRDRLKLQNDINIAQKTFQDGLRKNDIKLR